MNSPTYSKKHKFFIIAGENSGDLHASNLVRAVLNACPDAEFCGLALSAGQSTVGTSSQVQDLPLGRVFEIDAADIATADDCCFYWL